MFFRAGVILQVVSVIAISFTIYFSYDVLVALGLILMQAKVVAKKLVRVELPFVPGVTQGCKLDVPSYRVAEEMADDTALPLLVGKALLHKLDTFLSRYCDTICSQCDGSIGCYNALGWYVKVVATLIVVFATLGLSVSSVGLWVILVSVKLPFWLVAAFSSGVRMT